LEVVVSPGLTVQPNLTTILISVECGEGWISFDNSCYKYDAGQNLVVSPRDGNSYCSATHPDSHLFVPNSRDESAFIGNYLKSLQVFTFNPSFNSLSVSGILRSLFCLWWSVFKWFKVFFLCLQGTRRGRKCLSVL